MLGQINDAVERARERHGPHDDVQISSISTKIQIVPNAESAAIRWGWRQRLERGDVAKLTDLAPDESLSDCYLSCLLRLAWLAPDVLERLVVRREPSTISIYDLCFVASLPWGEQPGRVFD